MIRKLQCLGFLCTVERVIVVTQNKPFTDPYRPSSSASDASKPDAKALKYIAHGVYLQIFFGVGLLTGAALGVDVGRAFFGPQNCGAILVGLALNSLIYIRRYTKSLG